MQNLSLNLTFFILPLGFIIGGLLAVIIFEKVILKKLNRIAEKTKWEGYKIVISSINGMTIFWFVITGVYGAVVNISLSPAVSSFIQKGLLVVFIFSVTIVAARITAGFVNIYSKSVEGILPSTTIFVNIAKLFVFVIGILIMLQSLGISITPILTALGVGGLAVALALQDTLANLFAGLHIIASKQVKQGDYIKLSSDEEGYVTDITWRNTTIKTLSNNMIVIPNSKAASSVLTNYFLPDKEFSLSVQVIVGYENPLEYVEKITLETAKEVYKNSSGNILGSEPSLRFQAFGESGVNLNVSFRVKEFTDQYHLKHEFIKELHKKYRETGIAISSTAKAIYIKEAEK